MIRTLLLSAALVAGPSTLALAGASLHQGRSAAMDGPPMVHARHHRVTATGRCNGVSYGTGQRSCGTKTGGTPGGNPSRN